MKIQPIVILLILSMVFSCKKDSSEQNPNQHSTSQIDLSLSEIQTWLAGQASPLSDSTNWASSSYQSTESGTSWQILLKQKPEKDGVKGYSKLLVHKDRKSGQLKAKLLDYLYDAHYLIEHPRPDQEKFSGRLYIRDLHGKLEGGYLLSGGKTIGEISPDTSLGQKTKLRLLSPPRESGSREKKISAVIVVQNTYWIQTTYVDANGVFTVHSERITTYTTYNTGMSGVHFPGMYNPNGQHQPWRYGSGGSPNPPAPAVPQLSNLPGESGPKIDPRKMTKCFDQIPDQGATVNIQVYIQEPFPETTFNIGPNSVGHVAIGITKTNANQSVTQVMGFYPDAAGTGRYSAPSKILDNGGDLEYNVSASYTINTDQLDKILHKINNSPPNYHAFNYNCTNFVYDVLSSGGVILPDPTVAVGLPIPGGISSAMTPAGLSQAYRIMLYNNPNSKITVGTNTTPNSKGPCND